MSDENPLESLMSLLGDFKKEGDRLGNIVENGCDSLTQKFRLELAAAVDDPKNPLTERDFMIAILAYSESLTEVIKRVTSLPIGSSTMVTRHVIASLQSFIDLHTQYAPK